MKKTLLASVAALSLFAATSLAAAQGANQGGTKEAPAPKADTPRPPAGTQAPAAGRSADPTAKEKADPKATQQRTQDKAGTKVPDKNAPATKAGDVKGDTKPAAADKKPAAGQSKPAAADTKPAAGETKPAAADKKSGAAGSASAVAAPPPEKRTQISSTIKQQNVKEITNVNFNISIGTRVPRSVTYYPLPSRVIEIYPEWRGYYFILVNGRYLILRPQTYEIVYIIEG